MKAGIVFLLLWSTFYANAQLAANLHRNPDGSSQITLRNENSVRVSALAIRVDYVNKIVRDPSTLFVMLDSAATGLLESKTGIVPVASVPIAPQQEMMFSPEVMVAISDLAGRPTFSDLRVAAIFADGATTGDPELLRTLMARRANLLLAVDTSLDLLSEGQRQQVSRDDLIRQFQARSKDLDRWYVPSEQQIGREVFRSVAQALQSSPIARVSSDSLLNVETARLRQQRIALLGARPGFATEVTP